MERLTQQQLQALLDFARNCYACRNHEAFVTHLIQAIPTLIPCEVIGYNEIDLVNGRALETTRVEPATVRFPGYWQVFEQYLPEHPFATHLQQSRDRHAIKISDFLTQRQFHRLGLYNEFFRRQGVEYQMAALLTNSLPIEIAVTLNRSRRDFSERDRLLLNLLRPHLAQAFANATAITQMQQDAAILQRAWETGEHGVVVLTRDGRVRLMTRQARTWLADYFDGPLRQADRLPETLRAWIRHQEAQLRRTDDAPPTRTPLTVERDGGRLAVRHLCEADYCFLLLEEHQRAVQPASLEAFGLTRREVEVLQWVAQGKTNIEIGIILEISAETVRKHLQHIFEKLGVGTRTAAVAVAGGYRLSE